MGLLDDTVGDAQRALPGALLVRRSATVDAASFETDDTPEPADDGALTVYRLQKEGGSNPPKASPGSYPSDDAGVQAGRLEGVAVVNHGALRPNRKVIDRPETGQDRLLETQSDVSGVAASRVPEDPRPSPMGVDPVSAGSVSPSRYVGHLPVEATSLSDRFVPTADHSDAVTPERPSESYQESDSRNKLSKERRREDGLDAPSEDLSLASLPPQAGLHDTLMRAAQATRAQMAQGLHPTPQPSGDAAWPESQATATTREWDKQATTSAQARQDGLRLGDAAPTRPLQRAKPLDSVVKDKPVQAASATPSARSGLSGAGAIESANAGPVVPSSSLGSSKSSAPQQAPRLSIGRIEVVVLAPAAEAARSAPTASDSAAWLSKHYLRRL